MKRIKEYAVAMPDLLAVAGVILLALAIDVGFRIGAAFRRRRRPIAQPGVRTAVGAARD